MPFLAVMDRRVLIRALFLVSLFFSFVWCWSYSQVGNDFIQDYLSATALKRGALIYGPTLSALGSEIGLEYEQENYHPPSISLIFLPFTLLKFQLAFLLFSGLNIAIYCWTTRTLLRMTTISNDTRLLVMSGMFFWFPFLSDQGNGNFSVWLSALFTLMFANIMSGKGKYFSAALSGACLLKLFPALMFGWLLSRRRIKLCFGSATLILLGAVIILGFVGSENIRIYLDEKIGQDLVECRPFPMNHSLLGILSALFETGRYSFGMINAPQYIFAIHLIVSVLIVVMSYLASCRTGLQLGFCIFAGATLLVCPVVWSHTMLIALVPLAFLLQLAIVRQSKVTWVTFILIFLALSWPDVYIARLLYSLNDGAKLTVLQSLSIKLPFLGLFGLWLWLLTLAYRGEGEDRLLLPV